MTDFNTALDEKLPRRTAGSLPSSRTNEMVTQALDSADVDQLSRELSHTRAHYQSLEFMLNDEDAIVNLLLSSWDAGTAPEPKTIEEAIRLTVRAIGTEALGAAYDNAHRIGFFLAMGMDVQGALQTLYSDLDHADPDRELADDDFESLLDPHI